MPVMILRVDLTSRQADKAFGWLFQTMQLHLTMKEFRRSELFGAVFELSTGHLLRESSLRSWILTIDKILYESWLKVTRGPKPNKIDDLSR